MNPNNQGERYRAGISARNEVICTELYEKCKSVAQRLRARDVDETAQDTMVDLITGIGNYHPAKGQLEAWITTITKRKIGKMRRNRRIHDRHSRYLAKSEEAEPLADSETGLAEKVRKSVEPLHAQCMHLRLTYGRSHEAIATALGIPVSSVRNYLQQGMAGIKDYLGTENH